jgi:prepilin-type N-terminal cleavage/methylation domain-containing protein
MLRKQTGFTLIELLVSLTVTGIVMSALVASFSSQNRASIQRDTYLEMEENLRMGMANLSSALRNSGYGVPTANLNFWITEVSGFTNQPIFTANGGSTINIASCTPSRVAQVTANANVGQTTLTIDSASGLANGDLIWIGHSEFARVTNASTTLGIDTNPMASGVQGMARTHGNGSPICRVDIHTYSIQQDPYDWTKKVLMLDRHDGVVWYQQVVAADIDAIQLTTVTAGQRYLLTMTAKTKDPYSSNHVTRTMTSDIALVN